jgi:hypothetical protein
VRQAQRVGREDALESLVVGQASLLKVAVRALVLVLGPRLEEEGRPAVEFPRRLSVSVSVSVLSRRWVLSRAVSTVGSDG